MLSLAGLLEESQVSWRLFVYDQERSDSELVVDLQHAAQEHAQQLGCDARDITIGGFSRGARIAALLAGETDFSSLLGLGYPFHKRGAPKERHGLEALRRLQLPTLILQGTRDSHGNREQVRGYQALPDAIQIHWLEDGNHRYHLPLSSSACAEDLLRSAADATVAFLQAVLLSSRDH